MKQLTESTKPAIGRFLKLIASGNAHAHARTFVGGVLLPNRMQELRQKWEKEADRQALSEAISLYQEAFGTTEDPETLEAFQLHNIRTVQEESARKVSREIQD